MHEPPRYPSARQRPPARAPHRRHRKTRPVAWTIIAFAAMIIAVVVLDPGNGGSFTATVGGTTVLNPATLGVTVHVTNTGGSAATPTCEVRASGPSGTYSGFDKGTLTSPVPAGQTETFVMVVPITHEGAQYITQVSVSC